MPHACDFQIDRYIHTYKHTYAHSINKIKPHINSKTSLSIISSSCDDSIYITSLPSDCLEGHDRKHQCDCSTDGRRLFHLTDFGPIKPEIKWLLAKWSFTVTSTTHQCMERLHCWHTGSSSVSSFLLNLDKIQCNV